MWTARSFILGSRKDMAMDDAEDGITADNNQLTDNPFFLKTSICTKMKIEIYVE